MTGSIPRDVEDGVLRTPVPRHPRRSGVGAAPISTRLPTSGARSPGAAFSLEDDPEEAARHQRGHVDEDRG